MFDTAGAGEGDICMELSHGGDWVGYEREYGLPLLDFSANVSPFGIPERVKQAAAQALDRAEHYPDPLCRELREKLSEYHNIPAEWILCGNGASDLIYRLALAKRPQTALVTAPAFSEYENALSLCGCSVTRFPLYAEDGFTVTEKILTEITPELDMLFLCEPNNPTGRTTDRRLLEAILERCAACGTLLVVDECFNDLLDAPEEHTLFGFVSGVSDLLILRAFTKSCGMAGLRLGYALCRDVELLERMRESGPPWAVSGPAQAAGAAALEEGGCLSRLRQLIQQERPRLAAGLTALGCQVCPGEANFLLFFSPVPDLGERLRKRGILLRDCSNYRGLGPGWYRASVRTGEENQALLQTIREVL